MCSRTDPRCSKVGVARCSTCKAWYCSARCQADHWPRHWRDCLPLPDLEWLVQDDQEQSPVLEKKTPSSTTVLPKLEERPLAGGGKTFAQHMAEKLDEDPRHHNIPPAKVTPKPFRKKFSGLSRLKTLTKKVKVSSYLPLFSQYCT